MRSALKGSQHSEAHRLHRCLDRRLRHWCEERRMVDGQRLAARLLRCLHVLGIIDTDQEEHYRHTGSAIFSEVFARSYRRHALHLVRIKAAFNTASVRSTSKGSLTTASPPETIFTSGSEAPA